MRSPCKTCGETRELSSSLGVCLDCIRTNYAQALPFIENAHRKVRETYHMPPSPPHQGIPCGFCVNNCVIPEGEKGLCGKRVNKNGKIVPKTGSEEKAYVECYYDPLPTNCVSMNFCGERKTRGKKNLAVFYGGCTYDCLFCQNWHYRTVENTMSVTELASYVDDTTACICYFGGDPTPFVLHALGVAERIDVRVCWETNGAFSRGLARKIAESSLISGGTIKVDVKAFSEALNYALCGTSNKNTLSNLTYIYQTFPRTDPPLLTASTLLVPGYIDEEEVSRIAQYIAGLSPDIPYSLLAFHPHFAMSDLPPTSRQHAQACLEAAQNHLTNVNLGNVWLLT